jgi:hypothetical protein
MNIPIEDDVKRQIDALERDGARPLIICDVDEVVVHFVRSLEEHLDENGCWLDKSSFALNGNIRLKSNNEAVPTHRVGELLYGCFDAKTHVMDVIEGAADSLARLRQHAEIIMLTNLPERYLEQRVENLRGHGIPYPVVANSGHKGPAVQTLINGSDHTTVFIDDSPNNIDSVQDWCPEAHLVHFIQDQRFARHVTSISEVALRTDNWTDTHGFIDALVSGRQRE